MISPAKLASLSVLALALSGCTALHPTEQVAAPRPAAGEPSLAEVRALTERFQDVNVALKEGYIRDPGNMCDTADMMGKPASLGAMGVHYFRPDLLGVKEKPGRVDGDGLHTDFRQPSILIYEPQADGSMQLVAVENLVFQKAWHARGNKKPPSFHGVAWDTMQDDPSTDIDEAHMFEPHYDRHVWIYRDNPKGVFTPFNPAVSCKHHKGGDHAHHAAAVPDGASAASSVTDAHANHGGHSASMDGAHGAPVLIDAGLDG